MSEYDRTFKEHTKPSEYPDLEQVYNNKENYIPSLHKEVLRIKEVTEHGVTVARIAHDKPELHNDVFSFSEVYAPKEPVIQDAKGNLPDYTHNPMPNAKGKGHSGPTSR